MLTALTWTHPVHGLVTELLCPTHEPPARQAFTDLGIDYTERPVDQGRCHRCDQQRPWQSPQRPTGQAGQAPTNPDGGRGAPADVGWFQTGPRTAGEAASGAGNGQGANGLTRPPLRSPAGPSSLRTAGSMAFMDDTWLGSPAERELLAELDADARCTCDGQDRPPVHDFPPCAARLIKHRHTEIVSLQALAEQALRAASTEPDPHQDSDTRDHTQRRTGATTCPPGLEQPSW